MQLIIFVSKGSSVPSVLAHGMFHTAAGVALGWCLDGHIAGHDWSSKLITRVQLQYICCGSSPHDQSVTVTWTSSLTAKRHFGTSFYALRFCKCGLKANRLDTSTDP